MMSIKSDIKLTSVKIVKELYNDFKHVTIDGDVNLQQLVNRSITMYLQDENFKEKIDNYMDLKESGSSF
jgi:hypothetical protein